MQNGKDKNSLLRRFSLLRRVVLRLVLLRLFLLRLGFGFAFGSALPVGPRRTLLPGAEDSGAFIGLRGKKVGERDQKCMGT